MSYSPLTHRSTQGRQSGGRPDLRSDQGFGMPVKPGAPCAAGILTKRACAAKTSEPLSRL